MVGIKDLEIENLKSDLRTMNERVATLEEALVKEKDKLKGIWKMNCEQLAAYGYLGRSTC